MSEPFLAEIRIMGFNFAPRGWAACDGQILPINQNQALYALLGTSFGGDGRTTFALPDLRGRVPIHTAASAGAPAHPLGSRGGEESHTLGSAEMPGHTHSLQASAAQADTPLPAGNLLATTTGADLYNPAGSNIQQMSAAAVSASGSGQAHENMQPYLALNFCIALRGLFPSRD